MARPKSALGRTLSAFRRDVGREPTAKELPYLRAYAGAMLEASGGNPAKGNPRFTASGGGVQIVNPIPGMKDAAWMSQLARHKVNGKSAAPSYKPAPFKPTVAQKVQPSHVISEVLPAAESYVKPAAQKVAKVVGGTKAVQFAASPKREKVSPGAPGWESRLATNTLRSGTKFASGIASTISLAGPLVYQPLKAKLTPSSEDDNAAELNRQNTINSMYTGAGKATVGQLRALGEDIVNPVLGWQRLTKFANDEPFLTAVNAMAVVDAAAGAARLAGVKAPSSAEMIGKAAMAVPPVRNYVEGHKTLKMVDTISHSAKAGADWNWANASKAFVAEAKKATPQELIDAGRIIMGDPAATAKVTGRTNRLVAAYQKDLVPYFEGGLDLTPEGKATRVETQVEFLRKMRAGQKPNGGAKWEVTPGGETRPVEAPRLAGEKPPKGKLVDAAPVEPSYYFMGEAEPRSGPFTMFSRGRNQMSGNRPGYTKQFTGNTIERETFDPNVANAVSVRSRQQVQSQAWNQALSDTREMYGLSVPEGADLTRDFVWVDDINKPGIAPTPDPLNPAVPKAASRVAVPRKVAERLQSNFAYNPKNPWNQFTSMTRTAQVAGLGSFYGLRTFKNNLLGNAIAYPLNNPWFGLGGAKDFVGGRGGAVPDYLLQSPGVTQIGDIAPQGVSRSLVTLSPPHMQKFTDLMFQGSTGVDNAFRQAQALQSAKELGIDLSNATRQQMLQVAAMVDDRLPSYRSLSPFEKYVNDVFPFWAVTKSAVKTGTVAPFRNPESFAMMGGIASFGNEARNSLLDQLNIPRDIDTRTNFAFAGGVPYKTGKVNSDGTEEIRFDRSGRAAVDFLDYYLMGTNPANVLQRVQPAIGNLASYASGRDIATNRWYSAPYTSVDRQGQAFVGNPSTGEVKPVGLPRPHPLRLMVNSYPALADLSRMADEGRNAFDSSSPIPGLTLYKRGQDGTAQQTYPSITGGNSLYDPRAFLHAALFSLDAPGMKYYPYRGEIRSRPQYRDIWRGIMGNAPAE